VEFWLRIWRVAAAGSANLNGAPMVQTLQIALSMLEIQLNKGFPQTALALIVAPP